MNTADSTCQPITATELKGKRVASGPAIQNKSLLLAVPERAGAPGTRPPEVFLQTGTTVLLVSHDLEEAVRRADEVLRTVETLSRPRFVATKKLSFEIFRREVRR